MYIHLQIRDGTRVRHMYIIFFLGTCLSFEVIELFNCFRVHFRKKANVAHEEKGGRLIHLSAEGEGIQSCETRR